MSRRGSEEGQRVVLAGTLLKKHQKNTMGFLGKQYDKRFFVLTHDFLIYRHSPMDEDPNERSFDIRHLMSVTKHGNRSIELRFTERTLVIKASTDEDYERWYKALDLVRFQPLPYEVEAKELPVPQIVPPIVPRMPVTDTEMEYEGDASFPSRTGGNKPGLMTGRMRTSSLLEREIADRIAQSGVDPLVPPKFLKRLSQGSLDVMMTTANSNALMQHSQQQYNANHVNHTHNAPPHHYQGHNHHHFEAGQGMGGNSGGSNQGGGNQARIRDPLASGQYGGGSYGTPPQTLSIAQGNAGRRVATTGSMPGHHQPPETSGAPPPSHYHNPVSQQVQQSQLSGSLSINTSASSKTRAYLPLPLPDLEGAEMSPRSRLANVSNAHNFMNGTLPPEDPSPGPSAAQQQRQQRQQEYSHPSQQQAPLAKTSSLGNRPPSSSFMPQQMNSFGLRPLSGRLSDDSDNLPPPPPAAPAPRNGGLVLTDEEDSFVQFDTTPGHKSGGQQGKGTPPHGSRPRDRDPNSLELYFDEEGSQHSHKAYHQARGGGPPPPRDVRTSEAFDSDEDFDSESPEGNGRPQATASYQPSRFAPPSGRAPVASNSGVGLTRSPSGQRLAPKPPAAPRPQDSFQRMPQAPSSRPESRTGSDFRRRRPNSSSSGTNQPLPAPPPPGGSSNSLSSNSLPLARAPSARSNMSQSDSMHGAGDTRPSSLMQPGGQSGDGGRGSGSGHQQFFAAQPMHHHTKDIDLPLPPPPSRAPPPAQRPAANQPVSMLDDWDSDD